MQGRESQTTDIAVQFIPVQTSRASEQIAKQIQMGIENGSLQLGQKLPGERALAESFGTSRNPIREALRILEALGFVNVVPGKGTFIAEKVDRNSRALGVKAWFSNHYGELGSFFEVKETLNMKAAQLAAERCPPAAIQRMETAIAHQEVGITADDETQVVASDLAFHHALIEAACNVYLEKLAKDAEQYVRAGRKSIYAILGPSHGRKSLAEHRAILEAVKARDPGEACRLVHQHEAGVREILLDFQKETEA